MSARFFLADLVLRQPDRVFNEASSTLDDRTWKLLGQTLSHIVEAQVSENEIHLTGSDTEPDGWTWWLYVTIKRGPDGHAEVEFWEPGG